MLCLFEKTGEIEDLQNHQNDLFENIVAGSWRSNIEKRKNQQFADFLASGSEDFDRETKLLYAISCLFLFVQENFTGPSISSDDDDFNPNLDLNRLQADDRWKIDALSVDGVEINSNIKHLPLLLVAKNFIKDLFSRYPSDVIISVWYMRVLRTHQSALEENSISLYDNFRKVQEQMAAEKTLDHIANLRHKFVIELEIISIFLMYRRVSKAGELMEQLKGDYQIEAIEEGVLGMRTKWQQKALPQFHVSIKQQDDQDAPLMAELSSEQTHGNTKLLRLLDLDDDTRLETIQFVDGKRNELQPLSSPIQNFILVAIKYMQISQPNDKLVDEKIQPYLMLLLKQHHGPWPIRLDALLINIKSEANHRRTVDRSLRQCEDVVNCIKSSTETTTTHARERMSYIFSSVMTPRYKIEAQLADLMVSLGLIKGALDIYLETHQWENVISCYTRLQLKHKAAEVIQQQLAKQPTTKLYCLLGDATDDVSHYEQAWEFSKHKSGLAQRHWGMFYFGKNNYEQAIPHLHRSLEINSLQENLWLRLGYAALSLEKYELATSAYLRYTQLEPNGFESWNNLAKCFIKLGDKKRAHKILQEALKCNYDNWKIWENFLLVSIDTGSFEDALNAYNRLIELKETYFDEEVLTILIKAISENLVDANGVSSSRLRKKAIELLAHLGSLNTTVGVIWELSALLTIDSLKKAQKLLKAYRGYTSKSPDWSKDETLGLKLLNLTHDLCVYSLEASNEVQSNDKMLVLSQLSSARLTAQGCMKVAINNNWSTCRDVAEKINEILDKIVIKIKEMK